jgi:hypothetical protein
VDLFLAFGALVLALVVALVLVARLYPGTGADLLDWDPSERFAARVAADAEDMDELLAAHNARRRARGLPEQTEEEFRDGLR